MIDRTRKKQNCDMHSEERKGGVMLLKSFNGSIVKVAKAEPITETCDFFNGTIQRRTAVAKDMEQAVSGVLFFIDQSGVTAGGFDLGSCFTNVLVGNLKREVVEEILDSMLWNGYADICGYSYQKEHQCICRTVFDNGESDPYYVLNAVLLPLEQSV